MMLKPAQEELTDYFRRYISQVEESNLLDALMNQVPEFITYLKLIPAEKEDYRYAPGKWTVKEVIQHIIDTERVFAYRALCFSRRDPAHFPGFEQDEYNTYSNAPHRRMQDLIEEFDIVRRSSVILFRSFTEEQLHYKGIASERESTPLMLGFAIAGHCRHHQKILSERYL